MTALAAGGAGWWARRSLGERREHYTEGAGLDDAFRRVHYLSLAERDEVSGDKELHKRSEDCEGLGGT
jgi:hypothetical protein